jgi:hypothetical protein
MAESPEFTNNVSHELALWSDKNYLPDAGRIDKIQRQVSVCSCILLHPQQQHASLVLFDGRS